MRELQHIRGMWRLMSQPVVLVIDAGLGNIGSVMAALQREDCISKRLAQPTSEEESAKFTHVILPGVGSFAAGMQALNDRAWSEWIRETWCIQNRPFLGICLGMQLLASGGTEGAKEEKVIEGLGLIPGRVDRMKLDSDLVLPHIGWNNLHWTQPDNSLTRNLDDGSDMYFVHSYTFKTEDFADVIATSEYGQQFTAAVGRRNCFGVQFHPEKSQGLGRRLLQNFLQIPVC